MDQEELFSEKGREAAEPAGIGMEGEYDPQPPAAADNPQSAPPAAPFKRSLEATRDFEKDAAFARIRREAAAAKEEARRLRETMARAPHPPASPAPSPQGEGFGFDRLHTLERENEALRRREVERVFADDLAEIRKAYPEERAKEVGDLGQDFLRLRAAGVGTLAAFEAARALKERRLGLRPPSTGSVKSASAPRQDYFTEGELDRLSKKELDDPKVLQKAIASLARLGKNK